MTREKEIKLTADKYCRDEYTRLGFVAGAEWADAHPDIDVRTMAAWRGGYKEAIEKACDLLRDLDVFTEDFINDFRKTMERRIK